MKTSYTLDGETVSTIVAVLFIGVAWEFENRQAIDTVKSISKNVTKQVHDRIVPEWLDLARSAGIKSPFQSARPSDEVRDAINKLSLTIGLDREELGNIITISKAVMQEFSSKWVEFAIVTPGAIEHYNVNDSFIENFIDQMLTIREDFG